MTMSKTRSGSLSITNPNEDFETISLNNDLPGCERNRVSPVNLMTLCTPFVAYQIQVDMDFLNRHGLVLDSYYAFTWQEARNIVDDAIGKYHDYHDRKYQIGGYAFVINNLIQWLLVEPQSVATICASGGLDNDALRTLLKQVVHMGVLLLLEQIKDADACVNLILQCNKKRCDLFIGDFDAIACTQIFLDRPVITKMLERANCFFIGDTSLAFQSKIALKLAEFALMRFKQFIMALFNIHLLRQHKTSLIDLLLLTDVLFITPECCRGLIQILEIQLPCCGRSLSQQTRAISKWLLSNSEKNCIVITSDGHKAYVHCGVSQFKKTSKFSSQYMRRRKRVIDENGYYMLEAIYGFVAGFIAMMLKDCPLEMNVDAGFFAASLISRKFDALVEKNDAELFQEWKNKFMKNDDAADTNTRMTQVMPFTMFPTPWKSSDKMLTQSESFKSV